MMQHIFLKYPPQCEVCGITPKAKEGIWHQNIRDTGIYLCNKCKEADDANTADTLETR